MENYKIKDEKLASVGLKKLYWAETRMPVLMTIKKEFKKTQPFKNLTLGVSLHVTKETGVLVRTIREGGGNIILCACNPLSTQDDVAAALVKDGIKVYAWRGQTKNEYYSCINKVLDFNPEITIDDGCDLVSLVHKKRPELLSKIRGGCEETVMGVNRLKVMEKEGILKYPMIAVNDAYTKYLFDNRYGTGQSSLDGILRSTNILFAGKCVVVVGYGWCGRGVAMRAKGLGARVVITEVDPIRALEAVMDGYSVMPIAKAAKIGDIFITVTSSKAVISYDHIKTMKDGAILANAGHANVEIDVDTLERCAKRKTKIRPNTVEYLLTNNKKVYLLGEGRIVNLVAAEGHPSEVMDMSFSTQALAALYIVKNHMKLAPKVYYLPEDEEKKIASLKLKSMDIEIDKLTHEQKKYLGSWQEGT